MPVSENQEPELGRVADADGPSLAILSIPRNHAKPYDHLDPPPKPRLASDPKPKASGYYRGSDETVSSVWSISSVFSYFIGANSGTSSAATSRPNSTNLDDTFKRNRTSRPPAISRFSAWTIDIADEGLVEKLYPSMDNGAVYALVQEAAKVGMYRGYVDIWQRKIIHEKWREEIWSKTENSERILEVC